MKTCRIADAIGRLDDDLIEGALRSGTVGAKEKEKIIGKESSRGRKRKVFTRIAAVAAAVAVTFSAGYAVAAAVIVGGTKGQHAGPNYGEAKALSNVGGIFRNYTARVADGFFAEIVPEIKIFSEKYGTVTLKGTTYSARGEYAKEGSIGEEIGIVILPDGEFPAYAVKGISSGMAIAVKAEGEFHLYANDPAVAPDTFGALWDAYDFESTLSFSRIVVKSSATGTREAVLQNVAECVALLKGFGNATLCRETGLSADGVSFIVSSETIGIYKREIVVSANGTLSVDLFGTRFAYEIGKDKAAEVIGYAAGHSVAVPPEPYEFKAWGEITEIGEGYFVINDEPFCVYGHEALTFRVSVGNSSFSRYITAGDLKVGDKIAVIFRGYIDTEHGNLIADGRKILKYREDKI